MVIIMIVKATKTNNGKAYRKFNIQGVNESSDDRIPASNQSSIDQLQWANEMMRREIWNLKERLSHYENVDYSQREYYPTPGVY